MEKDNLEIVNIDTTKLLRIKNLIHSFKESLDQKDYDNLYWRIGHTEVLIDDVCEQIDNSMKE